jgi:hypothetical protein
MEEQNTGTIEIHATFWQPRKLMLCKIKQPQRKKEPRKQRNVIEPVREKGLVSTESP